MALQIENSKALMSIDLQHIRSTLIRYCLALTGSYWDAEDLAQEACLKAMPILQGTNCHANPEAYLFRIAKNAWIDQTRKRRISTQVMNQFASVEQPLDVVDMDLEAALEVLLIRLSPLQRTVLLLRDVFGYSGVKAAELLGTTEGAVKAAVKRARSALSTIEEHSEHEANMLVDDIHKAHLRAYVSAIRDGDAQLLVHLMHNDHIDSAVVTSIIINSAVRHNRINTIENKGLGRSLFNKVESFRLAS
jgi:RNA polymerase sigma factor (sigma-70 family)